MSDLKKRECNACDGVFTPEYPEQYDCFGEYDEQGSIVVTRTCMGDDGTEWRAEDDQGNLFVATLGLGTNTPRVVFNGTQVVWRREVYDD